MSGGRGFYMGYNEPLERRTLMFNKKTKEERPGLEKAIDDALMELAGLNADSEEYAKVLEKIERLYKLLEPSPEPSKPVSKDALLMVAGNLAGIALILGYERAHVITSKALGFIIKSRI